MGLPNNLRAIHPFPARMAPGLVWKELPDPSVKRLRVLDPMAGSGTTLVAAKLRGHEAIGYDTDPLAVLIARSWLANVNGEDFRLKATKVLERARTNARNLKVSGGYPVGADDETRKFVRYWFDTTNRVQLAALARSISRLHDEVSRNLMWCAFSRIIITKQIGVSLAMDVSHSRPHKSYRKAPVNAFDIFENAIERIIKSCPFSVQAKKYPRSSMGFGDARELPLADGSVDLVITSPPYLNAIDYLRGHKFSLIWMGHSIKSLRDIRSSNIGTETASKIESLDTTTEAVMKTMCDVDNLSKRHAGMLRKYVQDMHGLLLEIKRVLRARMKAVLVIGNCNLRETFIRNSKCVEALAEDIGMEVARVRGRPLPDHRRYLPPPKSHKSGKALKKRMREEVILTLVK